MSGALSGGPPGAISSTAGYLAGLSDAEAARRRAAGEGNDFRPPTSRSYVDIFRQNTYPGINGILVVISLLLLAAGLIVEALLTAGPVAVNVIVGVVQETRAKQMLDRIALLNRPRAIVVREGVEREIEPEEIVRGDLVVARRGDQILVDGTLVDEPAAGPGLGVVELDEALLTGESDPVTKRPGDEVLSGTAVLGGIARYVAVRVGRASIANALLAEAREMREEQTPLQRDTARAIWIVAGLVVAAAVPVAVALVAGPGPDDPLTALNAAAVLVSLVPQGLAVMITVTYAVGALRISRLGALVQRQRAIESMSRVDILCVDKTGTLTTQRIEFVGAEVLDGALGDDDLTELAAIVAASARTTNRTTEALRAAHPGASPADLADEVPFSSERRWSAVRFADGTSGVPARDRPTFVLGAPEALAGALAEHSDQVASRAAALASRGARVLLLADAPAEAPLREGDRPRLPPDLRPVGLLRFREELRPDASATLREIGDAGIAVKIISGDDPATVAAIAEDVGVDADDRSCSGTALEKRPPEELATALESNTVFGRVSPRLKARLVGVLRDSGNYVAMVGDGVNDVLPLRRAQLGIAMGSGSPATRGAADLVLLNDNFEVLPRAIVEGQRIVAAMGATIIVLLSRTFYVLLIVVAAALLGLPFPLTPRQNAILALVTVGVPGIAIALWMPPLRPPASLLPSTLRVAIPLSVAVAAAALPAYLAGLQLGFDLDASRTMLTTIGVICGLGLLPIALPRNAAIGGFARAWPWLVMAAMLALYLGVLAVPLARDFYDLAPLGPEVLAVLFVVGGAWTLALHAVLRRVRVPWP
jgi:cation-transporting ATPase E